MTTDTEALTYDHIVALALSHGFKLKPQSDGRMALNDYVIDFARAVYDIGHAAAKAETAAAVAKERERASVLYDMLLNRPALNAGLESEYAAWTSKCYQVTGAYKAAIRAGAKESIDG